MVILITRPGEPGQGLAARLAALGRRALWWPAFDILPPEDPQAVSDALARLGQFDLVVFVSPMAVRALADARPAALAWPEGVAIAAVGGATRRAAADLAGATSAAVIGPEGDAAADGGAEALWPALAELPQLPRRVLIVRAQSGRSWLAQRLQSAGAQVEELVAYRRLAHEPRAPEWAALRAAQEGSDGALAVLFSSSEAVAAVTQRLVAAGIAVDGSAAHRALCVHERIAAAARIAGWPRVDACAADAEAIGRALAEPAPLAPAAAAGPVAGAQQA